MLYSIEEITFAINKEVFWKYNFTDIHKGIITGYDWHASVYGWILANHIPPSGTSFYLSTDLITSIPFIDKMRTRSLFCLVTGHNKNKVADKV